MLRGSRGGGLFWGGGGDDPIFFGEEIGNFGAIFDEGDAVVVVDGEAKGEDIFALGGGWGWRIERVMEGEMGTDGGEAFDGEDEGFCVGLGGLDDAGDDEDLGFGVEFWGWGEGAIGAIEGSWVVEGVVLGGRLDEGGEGGGLGVPIFEEILVG